MSQIRMILKRLPLTQLQHLTKLELSPKELEQKILELKNSKSVAKEVSLSL